MKFRLLVEFVTQTKEKFKKIQTFNPFKIGGGSKMKILVRWTKLNQILYTYTVGPQKARNAKTNHPKWGVQNKNSSPLDQHSLQKAEKSQPKHSVKKQAKFEKVVKSSGNQVKFVNNN